MSSEFFDSFKEELAMMRMGAEELLQHYGDPDAQSQITELVRMLWEYEPTALGGIMREWWFATGLPCEDVPAESYAVSARASRFVGDFNTYMAQNSEETAYGVLREFIARATLPEMTSAMELVAGCVRAAREAKA